MIKYALLALTISLSFSATQEKPKAPAPAPPPQRASEKDKTYPSMGHIERLDPGLDQLVAPSAVIEKLASGFRWAEGPVWVKNSDYLLLSDVPNNVIFRWQQRVGTRVFQEPSGYTGSDPALKEAGSNGLALDRNGNLFICQHGDREIARFTKDKKLIPFARYYNYRRFNSPNDLVFKSTGDLYFTDPPYGLPKGNTDPAKELIYSGVFKVSPKGEVTLLTSELSYPNGLAFSPDEKTLYIAVSDQKHPAVLAYEVLADGKLGSSRLFFDPTPLMEGRKGVPDGLKVDKAGNVWATGPGGVLVISPEGKHLGTINTGEPTANCAFGGKDGSVLYITANTYLCRIQTLTHGTGF
ncbi:MAG TPA: SMP-30/gluconolactonase/LRE family protein [Verrucomicrobiae bacterium]|jgi:gluconolactonase|nr:SMP-30/gluconolactonase/LRE family protein [Verrucomicrobiae bacterium]